DVWAVGKHIDSQDFFQTVIEHWNGTSWTKSASINPGGAGVTNELNGVTALSSGDAWAVGTYPDGTGFRTLTLHWDGAAWTHVRSPNASTPGNDNTLYAVAAVSASDLWAVGNVSDGSAERTLILHRVGSVWGIVPSSNPVTGPADLDVLDGVTATSANNAWAV